MTWFWVRIAVWSSLHEPVLIYGSSHGSFFKSPVYRVHGGTNLKSSVTGPDLMNGFVMLQHATQPMNSHEHTLVYIHTSHLYTYKHAYAHVYTHLRN